MIPDPAWQISLRNRCICYLRKNPRELVWYYLGAGPFAVALLYFWGYVTWFAPARWRSGSGSFIPGGFIRMDEGVAQHRFALCMLARRLGEASPRWKRSQWVAEIAAQLRLQASGVVLVPLSALFAVPFGWVYCYYQSATALAAPGEKDSVGRRHRAWEQMQLWPAQNHWALTIFSGLWLMVFLNIAMAFYTIPALATRWLGIKTIFAFSGWSYLNSIFLCLGFGPDPLAGRSADQNFLSVACIPRWSRADWHRREAGVGAGKKSSQTPGLGSGLAGAGGFDFGGSAKNPGRRFHRRGPVGLRTGFGSRVESRSK